MDNDERITTLESRIAFQEDELDKLNDAVTRQDKSITELKQMLMILNNQLKTAGNSGEETAYTDEPPPHY